MDPVRNPYAPGAGTQPPELAGRDELREMVRIALERARIGRSSRNTVMVGLRGVGKTVLLDRMLSDAESVGICAARIESPENRSLPSVLAPQLRQALLRLSNREAARELAHRALRALAGFAGALKVKYQDIEVGLDLEPEPGLADNGDLEADLQDLLEACGEAARSHESCIALFIDEIQYVKEDELAALITALHRTSQRQLPIVLIGAGLPQARGNMGRAKTYAERLFEFPEIGPLSKTDARTAISKPALDEEVRIESDALDAIVSKTQGYPYFLQEWGKHVWDVAESSPITLEDVELASKQAIATLDGSFFLVRFERLTPREKKYLRAMAGLGAGPHLSGDVASAMGLGVRSLGPTRGALIAKGMIWSPDYGQTAFTVPMFDEFMRRTMRE